MFHDFKKLSNLQRALQGTSKTTEKKVLLNNYKNNSDEAFNRLVLPLVFDGDINFRITSERVLLTEVADRYDLENFSIIAALNDIIRLNGSNAALAHAKKSYNTLVAHDPYIAELFLCIIDKDLKCGVSRGLVKDVFPYAYKVFNVALANKYSDYKDKVNFATDTWYASRKMDGCRCIAVVDNDGKCTLWSRQGKEFLTLDKVKKEIESAGFKGVVFDGECCIVDENGDEHFDWIMKEIKRKNHTISNPMYQVFDVLTLEEFYGETVSKIASERYSHLNEIFENNSFRHMRSVAQTRINNLDHFNELFGMALELGWEGLIIRRDVPYEGKRTNNMLKCKSFSDSEYKVVDCNFGKMRFVENGQQVELDVMTDVVVEHKGYKVSVGSGFSKEQRIRYKNNPELIVGKTITVQYFEETKNQDGGISLRFPTVKAVYEEGRDL